MTRKGILTDELTSLEKIEKRRFNYGVDLDKAVSKVIIINGVGCKCKI